MSVAGDDRTALLSNVSDDFTGHELAEIFAGPYLKCVIEAGLPPYAMVIPLRFIPIISHEHRPSSPKSEADAVALRTKSRGATDSLAVSA